MLCYIWWTVCQSHKLGLRGGKIIHVIYHMHVVHLLSAFVRAITHGGGKLSFIQIEQGYQSDTIWEVREMVFQHSTPCTHLWPFEALLALDPHDPHDPLQSKENKGGREREWERGHHSIIQYERLQCIGNSYWIKKDSYFINGHDLYFPNNLMPSTAPSVLRIRGNTLRRRKGRLTVSPLQPGAPSFPWGPW